MRPIPPIPAVLRERADWTVPAPEWEAWMRETLIEGGGPLVNLAHAHLAMATIGVLLTNSQIRSKGKEAAGLGGVLKPSGEPHARAQRVQQLTEWFGHVPDFLVLLKVTDSHFLTPRGVCALIDHELAHLGCVLDEHGGAAFGDDGRPRWRTVPHYAELCEGDLARWGAAITPGGKAVVAELSAPPLITDGMLRFDDDA